MVVVQRTAEADGSEGKVGDTGEARLATAAAAWQAGKQAEAVRIGFLPRQQALVSFLLFARSSPLGAHTLLRGSSLDSHEAPIPTDLGAQLITRRPYEEYRGPRGRPRARL